MRSLLLPNATEPASRAHASFLNPPLTERISQATHELPRPIVLFGRTPAERARETGVPERTLRRQAERFDASGMASLFEPPAPPAAGDRRALPAEIRQAIVALKAD